ncbi:hypothetical protein LTR85_007824 [Meristemomyces frigidus]|nr:hypothetical protein LTR85_007824 [Meristemomyces frigidus]
MQLLATLIAIGAYFMAVSAAVLAERATPHATTLHKNDARTIQQQQVMANLSSAFGWTMAGSALSDNELDVTCANITNTGHHKWDAEGLMPEYIVEPICNASHSSPNTTVDLPWTILYNTKVFVTQLTNAFAAGNADAALTYLCGNLRFILLDGFHMMDGLALRSTCTAAGLQAPPRPAQPAATVNPDITNAYVNTASILYGLLFASSATSDTQLNIYCAHAPEYVPSLNALMLNGTLVQSTICNVQAPISTEDGIATIRTWTSRIFITVVENVSNVDGWLSWLCENLDTDAMEAVGLDGQAVHTQVCNDAKAVTPS